MPESFEYIARTFDGKKRTGLVQAEDSNQVADILSEQQLIPTEIKPHKRSIKPGIFGFMKSRLYEDLIIFTRNLSTLYRSGIPILRALSIIKIGEPKSYFNQSIMAIKDNVQSGRSLSDSLKDFPKIYPNVYTASVAAGVNSGKLDLILDSLGIMLEKDLELNRQIKASVRYPIIVVAAISAAFVVLFTFVIPKFVHFYSKMGSELPLPTKMLIWINQAITNYWLIVVAGVVALFFGIRYFYLKPRGRLFFDTTFLKIPIFGDLILKGTTARFAYIFQILTNSGIPLVSALEMLTEVVKNTRISREIDSMADSFRGGRELDVSSETLIFFPDWPVLRIA